MKRMIQRVSRILSKIVLYAVLAVVGIPWLLVTAVVWRIFK